MNAFPTLHHYSATPIAALTVRPNVHDGVYQAGKPSGFWVSDDSEFGWAKWCEAEQYQLGHVRYRYEVKLAAPERLLWLRDEDSVRLFISEFGIEPPGFGRGVVGAFRYREPDWQRVAQHWGGVVITPYQWSLRLADGFMWYYGWDCASGVIWDVSTIASLVPVPMIPPWTMRDRVKRYIGIPPWGRWTWRRT